MFPTTSEERGPQGVFSPVSRLKRGVGGQNWARVFQFHPHTIFGPFRNVRSEIFFTLRRNAMKPVDQTQFAGEGVGGNCVQASVASILGLPMIDVPHFLEIADQPEEWELAFMDWLEERGVGYIRRGGDWVFDGFYLASGPSQRGVNHMVVYHDGQLAHDPHPSRAGLIEVRSTWVLCPLDPSSIKLKVPAHVAAILNCLR